ncbi:facilitated trehalose transporter Tret1-2 homolog [Bacillus rossius redtenbacheri]|uniref:facilitated trehalose transporter Tret1-2 homolog n=1 Tax=Bacillus rossius redtenbacheri TaxID=93214 RepID=UPI002FDD76DD
MAELTPGSTESPLTQAPPEPTARPTSYSCPSGDPRGQGQPGAMLQFADSADNAIARWQGLGRPGVEEVNLATLCGGCIVTWVSPALTSLAEQTSLVLTTAEQSWVGSMQLLASVLGPAPAVFLVRLYGCRATLMAVATVYACGWVLVAAMRSVQVLLVGRFVLGLAMGATFAVLPIYTGEIAQAEVRGVLGSFFMLFFTSGFLLEYSVGPFVSYLALALLSGALPLALLAGLLLVPDSPRQLLARGRVDEARAALAWLRNCSGEEVSTELELIKASEKARAQDKEKSSFQHLATRGNLKALALCLALCFFQQMSGATALATYTQTIFAASGAGISPTLSTIVTGVSMVLAGIASCLLIDLVGRRPLIFVSSAGVASSMILLGTYFHMKEIGDVSKYGVLPITCAIGFNIFYGIGWGPVPMTVAAEVFSGEVKERAVFLTMACLNFLGFLNARFFLEVAERVGMGPCFWFFGGCSLAGALAAFLCTLPRAYLESWEHMTWSSERDVCERMVLEKQQVSAGKEEAGSVWPQWVAALIGNVP